MVDVNDLIAEARPAEKTVELCLRSDLVAALEDVQRRIAAAADQPRGSLGDDGGLPGLRAEAEEIRREAREHTVVFRFRALNRWRMQQLMAESPPRDGNPVDKKLGYNADAVTYRMARDCCYEPVLSDESWERLLGSPERLGDGVLSPGQWQRLDEALSTLNFSRASIPF